MKQKYRLEMKNKACMIRVPLTQHFLSRGKDDFLAIRENFNKDFHGKTDSYYSIILHHTEVLYLDAG